MSTKTPDESKPIPAPNPATMEVWQYTGVSLLVFLSVVVVGLYWHDTVKFSHRDQCKQHLKTLTLALHQYHEVYECFPPAYTVDENGKKLHSWRALLLPFVGQESLYSQIHFDEPWNSKYNVELSKKTLELFACPASNHRTAGHANYFAVVGPDTPWPEQYSSKLRDIADGTSNTIMLVDADIPNASWMEPRDLTRKQATNLIKQPDDGNHYELKMTPVVFADGSARMITGKIHPTTLWALTSCHGGTPLPGVDWTAEHPASKPAFELKQTEVWPVTDQKLIPGRNNVYCCTFQMAWDNAKQTVDTGAIEVEGNPPVTISLNAQSYPTTDLSSAAYVVKAGIAKDVLPVIQVESQQRFPEFRSRLHNRANDLAFVFYAYFEKKLPFLNSFDRQVKPLLFGDKPIQAFGIRKFAGRLPHDRQLSKQVVVVDYQSDDDFIIRLIPGSGRDEILLAKVAPGKTLAETIALVRSRCQEKATTQLHPNLINGDSLVVPILNFNLEQCFDELIGGKLTNHELPGIRIADARQIIRFQLDRHGTKLESEAGVVEESGSTGIKHPRKLHFDKPFLIWLRESRSTEPYFAAWIENSELMTSFAR